MRLVILDRDGVINEDSPDHVKSVTEWRPLPGSIAAIARLGQAGYRVVVATNQSGLARGLFGLDELEAIHAKMIAMVEAAGGTIDGIFYCPHGPDAGCDCRKPAPGLLDAIARELGVELHGVPLIGDSLRDLQAGLARGCLPILVRTGKGHDTEPKLAEQPQTALRNAPVFDDLAQATEFVLAQGHRTT